ncbi:MFS transporter [Nocardioides sp. LHD-245]|uniref:MFS transporter n=1 Tax=Nocardioides sp. LHD-245 TaxID=3051387 RepID=UPI0027E18FD6|nr:MFS transporter [Nocardioides sp. LHD-245]
MSTTATDPLWTRPYLVTVAATCLVFVSVGVTIPLLPFVVTDRFDGTALTVGLVFGASAVAAIAARPWLGPLGDRRGRRLLLIAGTVVAAAGLIGHLLAGSIAAMVAARLVLGLGQAGVMVAATTLALDLAPAGRHGEASSYLFIAVNGGLGTGPILGELLARADTEVAWLGAAATCLLAGLLALSLPAVRHHVADGGPVAATYGPALRTGALAGLGTLGFAGFLAMVPLYAAELDMAHTSLIFILASGTVVAVRVVAAKVPDRLGPRPVARTSFLTLAGGFTLMALWVSPTGLVVGTVIMAAGLSLLVPSLVLHATEGVSEGEETRRMSAFTVFLDLGAALGPSALGLVAAATTYQNAFLLCTGTALLGLALLLAWVPRRHVLRAEPAGCP